MRLYISPRAALAPAFGLLASIAADQGAVSIFELTGVRRNVTEVATNWLPSVVAVGAVREAASDVRIEQLRLLSLSDTPAELAGNGAKLAATRAKLAQARNAYEPLIASKEERALYDAFASARSRLGQADAEMRRLMEAGRQPAALELMTKPETAGLYDEARADLARDVALN